MHEARFADAWNSLEEDVSTREQTRHGPVDDIFVAYDPASHLLRNANEPFAKAIYRPDDGFVASW
jgi:hypothetical protein